jgi:hypothetical protein
MEPEGSMPNSQELSTYSYSEPDQSSPHHRIPPLQDPFIHTPTSVFVSLAVFFPLIFLPITYTRSSSSPPPPPLPPPIHAACPVYPILIDFMILITLDEEY